MNAHAQTLNASAQLPQTIHFLGSLLTFRARAQDTNGSFSVIECLSAPGAGAPPHHQSDEEAFLVTEGSFEFMLDGAVKTCGPGEFLYVKPGSVHAFRNTSAAPSKMLIFNLPGGLHEGFFLAAGDAVASGQTEFPPMSPPDVPFLVTTAARFGIEILPPPAS
jgi:quercetin dioxygenase-like cupin family protein